MNFYAIKTETKNNTILNHYCITLTTTKKDNNVIQISKDFNLLDSHTNLNDEVAIKMFHHLQESYFNEIKKQINIQDLNLKRQINKNNVIKF